ncbi:uncharacterized protein ColSpa_05552 [Colletotrichum spaethianum]|uniref:Bacteriophage T5 Orf172 DNA-binding domain-containing protein n=1 Tax=Colletotrichum spaethianum TaxID=700344 RepID=A0AA37LB25_9PEZI|nr:uncharacterized protein ColSpa_05552 [Colletotrichum spaethianum]GKT45371.1 hypothetical protein ColSpa_05552 [Colletotrichum spaethianum]
MTTEQLQTAKGDPFNVSPDGPNPELPGPRSRTSRRVPSGRVTRGRGKAAKAAQLGPESSPLMPTQTGLTPEQQPRARSSSIQLPPRAGETPPDADRFCPEGLEESDVEEVETPTKKPVRRTRAKPSASASLAGPSPLRRTVLAGSDVADNREETGAARPALGQSHTSPVTQDETERKGQRPVVAERSASDAVPSKKKLSGLQLDCDIANLINRGPPKEKQEDEKKRDGCVYFYKVKPRGREVQLVKIGQTTRDREGRMKQHQAQCRHLEMVGHPQAVSDDFPLFSFAEKLIHKELHNYRYRWKCICGRNHKEYFQVSEDIAVEVFERWRDFCKKTPWDSNGNLLPEWRQRLKNRPPFGGSEGDFNHRQFALQWAIFTVPGAFENFWSDIIRSWKSGFPNRWQIVAMVECLTVVYLAPFSLWAGVWGLVVIFLVLVDKLGIENLHITKCISRLMEGGMQSWVLWLMSMKDEEVTETKGLTPEVGPEEETYQQLGGDAIPEQREQSAVVNDQDPVDMGEPMDTERDFDSRGVTDDEDGADSDTHSSKSLEAASAPDKVSDRQVSVDLHVQKSSGVEVKTVVIDLTGLNSD